ncbi:MAG TPA: SPOR domain-containing protein [Bacteroidota bacterium]|nr:SPOR domain-containing protein [Bacteroidota bacterium]
MNAIMRLPALLVLCCGVLLSTACSSSEEVAADGKSIQDEKVVFERVDKDEPIIPETDAPASQPGKDVPAQSTPETVPVKPQGDVPATQVPETIPAASTPPATTPSSTGAPRSGSTMWSVQLGAFKNDAGALQLVDEIKQKFNQPVYKNYDPVSGYYKVTLGSFQSREDATRFRLDVQSRGYPDAFIVEVPR